MFLHGILGNKRNWRTVALEFVKLHPNFQAITVDHRGHGTSPHFQEEQNKVGSCAKDLLETLHQSKINLASKSLLPAFDAPPYIVCGHSFGGKVVLQYLKMLIIAKSHLPHHVWVLDSLPGLYEKNLDLSHQHSVLNIMQILKELPKDFESKRWIENYLLSKGISQSVVQWLGGNVIATTTSLPTRYKFNFNIDTVLELFHDYCELDMWEFLENYEGETKIHFIRAGKNKAWTHSVVNRFKAISEKNHKILVHTMPDVGHWLHTDNVHGMIDIISKNSFTD